MPDRHPDTLPLPRHHEPRSFATIESADHFARWQAHVDAGRIGTRTPADPAIAATRAHNDALFRERAARHRAGSVSDAFVRYFGTPIGAAA